MSNEVKLDEMVGMPKLTLEFDEAPAANIVSKEADDVRAQRFTEEEQKQIEEFANKINLHDTNIVVTYGTGPQKRLSQFSDTALEAIRSKDMGEVGDMLGGLVADLTVDPTEKKGLSKFFAKHENKLIELQAHYNKVEANIDKVVDKLETHEQTLMRDIAIQDKLYENNKLFFKEITMYIAAGKKALEYARNVELPKMKANATASGLTEDAQEVKEFADTCQRFEKRIHDLDLTRTICLQNAPQIKLVQNNAITMVDKIQSTINNTIPLWKNQMVISLGLIHGKDAVKAQQMVTDTTNQLLSKNAEMLHQSSVEIATANERGIVDMETLKHTNEELIKTIDEIKQIQIDGREKRAQAEQELMAIEDELKNKLMEVTR